MRVLVPNPERILPGRYRRFVRRAQLEGLLADHLYAGEPYLALNAIVLAPSEASLLQRLTESFATAFHKAGRFLANNVAGLETMGFPWAAAELLANERPMMPIAGRFDFLRDEAGVWWLLEFNADTPSGSREAIVADRLVHELLPEARRLSRPNTHLAPALVSAFRSAAAGLQSGAALGFVTDAGELEDLAQMAFTADLLSGPLSELGVETVLGDISNLTAFGTGLALCGRRLAALYRYVPLESLFGTTGFADIFDAATHGQVRLLNGLYGLLLQHKGLMAWLWSNREATMFTDDERDALRAHLPPTWSLSCLPEDCSPAELVIKQVFGREGEEVFFGDALSVDDLTELRRRRTYVAQQRIDTPALEAALPASIGSELGSGYVTVGSYAVAGKWAGFYSRFGGKIITARAKWLATFIESESTTGSAGILPATAEVQATWRSRGYLPHLEQPGATQMVTFRLADSLPAAALRGLPPVKGQTSVDRVRWVEAAIDEGHGSCALRKPAIARLVEDALLHLDGVHYRLLAWVIMPNHVHVLIQTMPDHSLTRVVHSWKSFTATAANSLLGRHGPFWQREYFDRTIRDERHLHAAVEYIHQNPTKAGLVERPELWRFSSARRSARGAGRDAGAPGGFRCSHRDRAEPSV